VAQQRRCELISPPYDEVREQGFWERGICLRLGDAEYRVSLLGKYQYRNATMAITAARTLARLGWRIDEDHIKSGLAGVRWRGRFEKLGEQPLVIYDGGHNPQGVAAAVSSYRAMYPDTAAVVLMGVMADKDYAVEIETLLPVAECFVTVRPDNPRALSAQALADNIIALGGRATAAASVEAGVAMAVSLAGGERPVLALGSLYMYGEIHAAYDALFGVQARE
jgi:dihydrofolate synthase/folylpolyglutamate synthase